MGTVVGFQRLSRRAAPGVNGIQGAVRDEVGLGYRERLAGDKEEVREYLGDSYLELRRQV